MVSEESLNVLCLKKVRHDIFTLKAIRILKQNLALADLSRDDTNESLVLRRFVNLTACQMQFCQPNWFVNSPVSPTAK